MSRNLADIAFRLLFSLIFIGLGAEHAVSDELLQRFMPEWVPFPRFVSVSCGVILIVGGGLIAIGYKLKVASFMLGIFLVVVTILVHAPALQAANSPVLDPADQWLWDTLQRSNFVRNLCLLGVCIMLPYYNLGDWSLEKSSAKRR